MKLTREYLQWKLSAIDRSKIVLLVDQEIQRQSVINDVLVDLSTSHRLDDYEFEKLLLKLVDTSMLTPGYVTMVVKDIVMMIHPTEIYKIMDGLHWLIYENGDGGISEEIDKLYWNLDHFLSEAIPGKYATYDDVEKYIRKWIHESAG